jgi:hypothetical protein
MDEPQAETPADRMRIAFELHEFAEAMVRQRWLRRHPDATTEEAEAAVFAWLTKRPGAEHGDCEGRSIAWPRSG